MYCNYLKYSDRNSLVNSVDPDQTALLERSDLGLHCLSSPSCAIHFYRNIYSKSRLNCPNINSTHVSVLIILGRL